MYRATVNGRTAIPSLCTGVELRAAFVQWLRRAINPAGLPDTLKLGTAKVNQTSCAEQNDTLLSPSGGCWSREFGVGHRELPQSHLLLGRR
eukprot:8573115-Pyramimonas_sp.AAC.1